MAKESTRLAAIGTSEDLGWPHDLVNAHDAKLFPRASLHHCGVPNFAHCGNVSLQGVHVGMRLGQLDDRIGLCLAQTGPGLAPPSFANGQVV